MNTPKPPTTLAVKNVLTKELGGNIAGKSAARYTHNGKLVQSASPSGWKVATSSYDGSVNVTNMPSGSVSREQYQASMEKAKQAFRDKGYDVQDGMTISSFTVRAKKG